MRTSQARGACGEAVRSVRTTASRSDQVVPREAAARHVRSECVEVRSADSSGPEGLGPSEEAIFTQATQAKIQETPATFASRRRDRLTNIGHERPAPAQWGKSCGTTEPPMTLAWCGSVLEAVIVHAHGHALQVAGPPPTLRRPALGMGSAVPWQPVLASTKWFDVDCRRCLPAPWLQTCPWYAGGRSHQPPPWLQYWGWS